MIQWLRLQLRPIFGRSPHLRAAVLKTLELLARPALLPFRLSRPPSHAPDALAALEADTGALNAAAERYYATYPEPEHLLDKPFSEPEALSRRLIDLGVLMDGLRLSPGQTVLELGAGTAWVSHLLNRYGCRTISVDVSPTAMALARKAFERDPRTNWTLDPRFVAYDGLTLPLDVAVADRAIIYDAFHHIPNPARVLAELRRVLTDDGIVAMSEPGRGHLESISSRIESATGVLEHELVLEDVAELALSSGFAAARVVVASHTPLLEIDAGELRRFMGGHRFSEYWKSLCAELDGHHYILLFAGDPEPTTRQPRRLRAIIRPESGSSTVRMRPGERVQVIFAIHNAGDTTWLHTADAPGWTRLGAHLYAADATRTSIDFDWVRAALPGDVRPGSTVHIPIVFPPIDVPGDYIISVDLVVEGRTWFADRGSMAIDLECRIE